MRKINGWDFPLPCSLSLSVSLAASWQENKVNSRLLPVPSAVPRRTRPAPSIHTYMLPATTAPPFIYLNVNLSLGIAADSGSASPAPSRGKPPRLSRRFKQNHCHRRHSAARDAARRRRGRMQSSHAPIEWGSERALEQNALPSVRRHVAQAASASTR